MTQTTNDQGFISVVYEGKTHEDLHTCLFACFLSQEEPKRIAKALSDSAWVEAMQEELLQFKLQKVWILVDLPKGKRAIGNKTASINDNTGCLNINTGCLNINTSSPIVTTASTETTYADYFEDETEVDMSNISTTYPVPSTPNTRIHKDHSLDNVIGDVQSSVQTRRMTNTTNDQGFISVVYEGKTHGDLYTCLFACFLSQEEPKRIAKALSDSAWVEAMQEELLQFKLQKIDVKSSFLYDKIEEEVYVCQPLGFKDPDNPDKVYKVVKALYDVKTASTPMDTEKPLFKDSDGDDVVVHLYRSIIGSLMYLTSSRPDIMFAVCACARFQVTPKVSHSHAIKRIFSDYVGASLDRKSTTGGCQFLGCKLISWSCKKQTMVATSSTEAEYVAATSCCR
ncbi:uncharacterized mitochondrial protein-like protein [Tanacetum coccineum]